MLWKSIFMTKSFMHVKPHMQDVFCVQALIIQSRNSKPITLASSKFFPGYPGKVKSRDGILQTLSLGGIFIPIHSRHPSSLTSIPASLCPPFPKISAPPQSHFCPWELKINCQKFPFESNPTLLYSQSNHPWTGSIHCYLYRNHSLKTFSSVLSCSVAFDSFLLVARINFFV